jgi:hypothetical protein
LPALPDPGRSRAVLIGASTYVHLEPLPAIRNNLNDFRDVLINPTLGGLDADKCTIIEEPSSGVDVYRAIRRDAEAAEDTLLVYFAGHGRTGARNELYLCVRETNPEELLFTSLPYNELREVVADSRATKKVVILDCCFSGRAIADQGGDGESIVGQIGIEGTYILTATAANAVALAPPGERYTAFTGSLLDLLYAGIPDAPDLLTFERIYPYLTARLISRQLPRPRQQGNDTISHLALTHNLAYLRDSPSGTELEWAAQLAAQPKSPKASALADIAVALAANPWDRAARLIADAEGVAQSLAKERPKASALADIAVALAATDPDRASRLIADAERYFPAALWATVKTRLDPR